MELVDSEEEKLSPQDIIIKSTENIGTGEYSLATALAIVAKETTMKGADTKQFGNTVFLAQRGTGKNKKKMVGRAFNLDIGKNFINNGLAYVSYLQKKGITHYTTTFEGDDYLNAFVLFQRIVKDIDTNISIGKKSDGSYIVFIKLGKEPIPKGL